MRLTTVLLSFLALFTLGGCRPPEPECGGVTDRTDPKAPKVIESKEITDFSATFCLMGEWSPGRKTCFYTFTVKKDGAGAWTVSESTVGVTVPADEALLTALQETVERHELVRHNGEYRVTAGLPPEYQPCSLAIRYVSGEKLTFTQDNDPDAAWAKEIYLTFADWFAGQGSDALLPPQPALDRVTNVSLTFKDVKTGKLYDYGIWSEPDDQGRRILFRYLDSEERERTLTDEPAFFAGLGEILGRYDLRPYDVRSALYGYEQTEADQKDPFSGDLELALWFEDGSQLYLHTSAPAAIDDLRPLVQDLFAYFDPLFGEE